MGVRYKKLNKIIFTDLDETLLNNNNYNFNLLNKFLSKLLNEHFSIIPVTSKTYYEVIDLLREMKLKLPFSTENGAAFYIPEKIFKKLIFKKIRKSKSKKKEEIKNILEHHNYREFYNYFRYIENLNIDEQIKITKLKKNKIRNFNLREFSVSILWDGSKSMLSSFKDSLSKSNLKITFGGKIFNISGKHSKHDSIVFFKKKFRKNEISLI